MFGFGVEVLECVWGQMDCAPPKGIGSRGSVCGGFTMVTFGSGGGGGLGCMGGLFISDNDCFPAFRGILGETVVLKKLFIGEFSPATESWSSAWPMKLAIISVGFY